jgi:hypothetical protein
MTRPAVVRGAVVTVTAVVLVAFSHDWVYVLREPLWGDEAWIVVTRLFPISDLPHLTSSAPIGWNAVVRLFSEALGDTGGRIFVQAFNVGAIIAAFAVGRRLPLRHPAVPRDVFAGVIALGIGLAPFVLLRLDLKHYSADTFFTLIILALCLAAARRSRNHRALVALTVVSALGLLFSFAVLFVAIAAFTGLLIEHLVRRDRREAGVTVVAGAIAAAGISLCYLMFYARGDNSALRDFWEPQFPVSVLDLPRFTLARLVAVDHWASFPWLFVSLPLLAIGVVVLVRGRHWTAALMVPVGYLVMGVLSVLHRYPLLDARTSTYLFVLVSVVTIASAIWLLDLVRRVLAQGIRRIATPLGTTVGRAAPAITVVVIVAALAVPNWRAHTLPGYDTVHQGDYVAEHRTPGDLVLFNVLASYQLGLTWREDEPAWCPDPTAWTGFYICYPDADDLRGFHTLDEAYDMIDAHLAAHPGARVWLIRSNVFVEYEQMEKDLPGRYDYEVIDLPYQPVGVVYGVRK